MKPIKHKANGSIIKEEKTDNTMRLIIKSMLRKRQMTMAELVRQYNCLHPEVSTTPQNLSNKLSRDTLRFCEFLDIIDICGYSISFSPIGQKNNADVITVDRAELNVISNSLSSKPEPKDIKKEMKPIAQSLPRESGPRDTLVKNTEANLKDSFADLATLGYAVVDSPNFGSIVIVGELADVAAAFIKRNLDEEITEVQEIVLCNAANREYKVLAKPIDSAARKFL